MGEGGFRLEPMGHLTAWQALPRLGAALRVLQARTHQDSAQNQGCHKGCLGAISSHLAGRRQGDAAGRLKEEPHGLCRCGGVLLPLLLQGWRCATTDRGLGVKPRKMERNTLPLVLPLQSSAAK